MSLIYLDEDLPEIEYKEIVTGDDDINTDITGKTGINIHSPEDIYNQLRLLLKSTPIKISAFQKLHADIIAVKPFIIPHHIVPEVSIQRRDNGDEESFFDDYDAAHKHKKHEQRYEAAHKAFIGFETTEEDEPVFPSKLPKTTVFIKNTNRNMTVILPNDDLNGTVSQLFTKIYSNKNISLVDKINLIVRISETGIDIDPSLSLEENISKITLEIPSEEIDVDEPLFKNLKPNKHHTIVPLKPLDKCSIHGFYTVQKMIFDKLQPILQKFKDELSDTYYAFIDAQINQPEISNNLPTTAYDIAVMVLENKTTLEEVTKTIKQRIFIKQRDFIEEWYALIEAWDVENILPVLSKELDLATKTLLSIQDDFNEDWLSINEEIKYIKRGEVISKDFVETIVNEKTTINDDDIIYDDDDTPPIYEDVLPVDISHLNEGTRELYEIVLKMFMALRRATGLQIDYTALTIALPIQVRRTRDVESITDLEFIRQLQYQWTHLLAWWICNLQEKVLSHRLLFQAWEGSLTSIHLWSPYGTPMEKPTKEGMMPYILSVIEELKGRENTLWEKYTKITTSELNTILNDLFKTTFKDRVVKLQNDFKTYEKDLPQKNLVNKGIAIKDKLAETLAEKNKANYMRDYMAYLKNLPAVLVKQSIARMGNGCCLQKVADITNEKTTYFKKAYQLKQLFATERVGFDKRPVLLKSGIEKQPDEEEEDTIEYIKPPSKEYPEFNIPESPDIPQIEKILDIVSKTEPIETLLRDFIFKTATTNDLIQSITKLAQIQYLNIQTTYKEHNVEYNFLIKEFKFHDLSENNSMNELQNVQYLRKLQYHLVNQMCFPAKPENARNNTLVLLKDGLNASLLKNFVKHTIGEFNTWVFNKTFNLTVNYADYIAKMREQDKAAKMKVLDQLSPEGRKLYKDANKLKIEELDAFLDNPYHEDDEYENKGENDPENDPDSFNDF